MNIVNIFLYLFSIIAVAFQASGDQCYAAEYILAPTHNWQLLTMEYIKKEQLPFANIKLYNSYVTPKISINVELVFLLSSPTDQNDLLILAGFHNVKSNVIFEEAFKLQSDSGDKLKKPIPVPTPCFSRNVRQIIKMDELIINSTPNERI